MKIKYELTIINNDNIINNNTSLTHQLEEENMSI